jgi:hypothetical protein
MTAGLRAFLGVFFRLDRAADLGVFRFIEVVAVYAVPDCVGGAQRSSP